MSVAATIRAASSAVAELLVAALGWAFVAPAAWLIPRRRDRVVVIGRDNGKFVDNAKYFYLQARESAPALQLTFLTERSDVVSLLRSANCPVCRFPSLAGAWLMLRSGTIVVDSTEWYQRMRRFMAVGAKVVQLWHGVGFKRIEIDKWRNEAVERGWVSHPALQWLRSLRRVFQGRLVTYDLVNTTSRFYRDEVFARAFKSRHFLAAGYPRNAFGAMDPARDPVAWGNVDHRISSMVPGWTQSGRKIVLVAPTFRDSRATLLGLAPEGRDRLDRWCGQNGVEFLFKFHPLERGAESIQGTHLHLCQTDSDIYPLLPAMSALVTDYSSIYMDYLLLDRPILFLVPDLDEYLRADRQIQFDFSDMTPGPKVASWEQLTASLLAQWQDDGYEGKRAALRNLAFDNQSQAMATGKILGFMQAEGWLPGTPRTVSGR